MKAFFLVALFAAPALAAPDEVLPSAYPASRYEKFARHSPFSPPTVAAPVGPPPSVVKPPGWADSLSIAAATQNGGNYLVTVVDRDSQEHFDASTDPLIKNGREVTLTSIQWADSPDQTQATLKRGTEFAVVRFDGAAVRSSAPVNGSIPRPGINPLNRPGFPPPPGNAPVSTLNPNAVRRNQIIRAAPTPIPRTNAVAPRPGVKLPGVEDDDDDDE